MLDGLDVTEAPFEEWLVGEREQLRILALGACEKMLAHQLCADADGRCPRERRALGSSGDRPQSD